VLLILFLLVLKKLGVGGARSDAEPDLNARTGVTFCGGLT
jgi:hypothetical protein